jgi:tetratricopeptide (TPR) repeat protein
MLLGDIWAAMGETAGATEMYELAVENLRTTPNRYAVEAFSKLADLYEGGGQQQKAFAVLKEAVAVQQAVPTRLPDASAQSLD